jgi:hypothetical protein
VFDAVIACVWQLVGALLDQAPDAVDQADEKGETPLTLGASGDPPVRSTPPLNPHPLAHHAHAFLYGAMWCSVCVIVITPVCSRLAAVAGGSGRLALVDVLLGRGAGVNKGPEGGARALHHAAGHNDVEVAKRLLGAGADTGLQCAETGTALHWAAGQGAAQALQVRGCVCVCACVCVNSHVRVCGRTRVCEVACVLGASVSVVCVRRR